MFTEDFGIWVYPPTYITYTFILTLTCFFVLTSLGVHNQQGHVTLRVQWTRSCDLVCTSDKVMSLGVMVTLHILIVYMLIMNLLMLC